MSATMTRSLTPSPTFGQSNSSSSSKKKLYSPGSSPKPFLTPNPFDNNKQFSFSTSSSTSRPLPRRLLSLQPNPTSSSSSLTSSSTIRSSPYTIPSPISPISPIPPPYSTGGLGLKPKRPNMSHRSISFCASTSNSNYALASSNTSSHLSPDKRVLVAPPLERTLSSIGSKGNQSPPSQQMQRPFSSFVEMDIELDHEEDIENQGVSGMTSKQMSRCASNRSGNGILSEKNVNCPSPQYNSSSPIPNIPTIYVHSSITPPRPSLSTTRNDSTFSESSRSSSFTTTITTPMTPHGLLFQPLTRSNDEVEKSSSEQDQDQNDVSDSNDDGEHDLSRGVDYLMI